MAKKASKSEDILAPPEGLTQEEAKSVTKRRRLRAAVVYEIIRTEGEGELARTFGALWWSGLAAGISIGFSVLSQAMLAASLFELPGATVIANVVLSWLSNSHSVAPTALHREHADSGVASDCEQAMAPTCRI